jgi:mono/diheme cytochrome c family protein
MTNPVHPTAESQAHAKATFSMDCAMCHGAAGDGKGDIVADMKLTMKDWTADPAVLGSLKDGEIFYIVKNGKGKMPGEAGRAKDDDMWNLVVYVRSLGKR